MLSPFWLQLPSPLPTFKLFYIFTDLYNKNYFQININLMENFIKLQNILLEPNKTFDDFKQELINSQITQHTYICLLLNLTAAIKRPNFDFKQYLNLLINFKQQPGYQSSCINYTGYKDKVSILMNACEKSVSSTVAHLASHPDIKLHLLDPDGFNAVFYAIKNSDQNEALKILEILYDLSPQIIDIVSVNGFSPLFLAVEKFRVQIVDFLLKNQIDPNQKLINTGNTAMHELIRFGSKHNVEEMKKMVKTFLRHNFDLEIKNNQEKTVEEYASDYRFNLGQILKDLKFSKYALSQSGCELSETQAYSSHLTITKAEDYFTTYNQSEQQNQFQNEIDNISVSNKSLLSEEINHIRFNDQRQFSLNMNLQQDDNEYDCNQIHIQLEEKDKKMECHSHSESPNSDFEVSNNQEELERNSQLSVFSESQDDEEPDYIRTQMINFQKISKQVFQFDQISQKIYVSAWKQMEPFFVKLHQITETLGLNIEVIGSFATGLWTHQSDIDIGLVTQNQNYVDFQKLLEKVFSKIKVRMYNMGIKQLSYNKASKIPSLKIEMNLHLFGSRKVDIMIFHKKNIAITYVNYIREALNCYGAIRPIFFFLKRVCEQFGLHDPFNGGMKSYSIFLMIYSMIRSQESRSLAQILLNISLYYGFYHEYQYEIEYRNNKNFGLEYVPVPRLNIKDPLNTKNNMGGKNTDVYRLKNMFRTIYYGLHRKIDEGTTLQDILELAKIIF